MPVLVVEVRAEVDGVPLPGFPARRRITMAKGEYVDYQKAADADTVTFTALPLDTAALTSTIQALLLRTDTKVTIRLNGQADKGIVLNPQGILVIVDFVDDAGAGSNAKVNNGPSTQATATIKGYAAGS